MDIIWGDYLMKRILCFMIIPVIISMSLSGCWWYKSFQKNIPIEQPNTKWISENKQVTFWVDENGHVTGIIENGDDKISVYFGMGVSDIIDIYLLENVKPNEDGSGDIVTGPILEYWIADYAHYDHFTATVERTTYFHVGEKITFYRVDGS